MRSTKITSTLTTLLIAALVIPINLPSRLSAHAQEVEAQAAPGDLDATFGNGGKVTISLPGKSLSNTAVAMQADGKIVVVGFSSGSTGDFVITRLNTDGSLDASFGTGGIVMTDFGSEDEANAVAVQADGKLVVAGSKSAGVAQDIALARYNSDGSLDAGFGNAGKVTTDFFGSRDQAWTVAIQTDGKILVGGAANRANNDDFALARYNANGSLDTSFGTAGKVLTDFFGQGDSLSAIAIQPDGKIVGAGYTGTSTPNSFDFALARYNADGTLDSSFGNGGKTITDFFGFNDDALAVKLASNGAIVVAGEGFTGSGNDFDNFALARYNANGSLDTNFGTGGKVMTDFGGHRDGAFALTIQANDKIIAAGFAALGSATANHDFALARYNLDGSLDQSFGTGGKVTTDFLGRSEEASAVILQADGQIVVAGSSFLPTPSEFALARYTAGGPAPAGFSLSFDQSSVTGERATTIKVHVLINRTSGFTGNVTVTPPDAPAGIKVKPPAPIAATDAAVTFKLKIKDGTEVGAHNLTFTGRDDAGHTITATLTLLVQ